MHKFLPPLALLGAIVFLAGCGDSHEKVVQDTLSKMKEFNQVMDTIKDESTAKAALSKMEAVAKDMQSLQERMKKLGEPPKEQGEALKKKYEKELGEVMNKMMANMMRLSQDPKVQAVIKQAMEKIEKAQKK